MIFRVFKEKMNNKEIAQKYFSEIWNNKNYKAAKEIISDQLETRFPNSHGYGHKGLMNVVEARYEVFPNLNFEIIDSVSESEKVWVLYKFSGTHKGEFWGIKPTGKKVSFNGILMLTIQKGKVVKASSLRDELSLLEQIGFINIPRDNKQ